MPDDAGVIRWYRPDPRAILPIESFHRSRSLQNLIARQVFQHTFNQDFPAVMRACADRPETWINQEFIEKYGELHRQGFAKSVEIWQDQQLVGGVYGVAIGGAFFAESMFHKVTNASKIALHYLVEQLKACEFDLLEVQFLTPHLKSLGAIEIKDTLYLEMLNKAVHKKAKKFGLS